MATRLTILGIDPGSQATGFGVVQMEGQQLRYVASGCVRTRGETFNDRLKEIFQQMGSVFAKYAPDEVAVERVFMHRNADSALKLGHARAAALCASFGHELPIHEYAAREIKQTLTGTGGADKNQVQTMVKRLLGIEGRLQSDAGDALAVAICHGHMRTVRSLTGAAAAAGRRR